MTTDFCSAAPVSFGAHFQSNCTCVDPLGRSKAPSLQGVRAGTKMRALYQRRQGRDLFDMAIAMKSGKTDPGRIVTAFQKYMEHEDHKVTRAMFEENFLKKLDDPEFMADISPLLASGYEWDAEAAAPLVKSTFIERLPGERWKGGPKKPEKEK